MGGKILFIFIVIIALGVGLYIYNSGTAGKGVSFFNSLLGKSTSTVYFSTSTPPGDSTAPKGYYIGPVPTSSYSNPPPSISPSEIPAGFTLSQISPYFEQVRFDGVSPSLYNYPGEITLAAYLNQGAPPIDVTGWQIRGNHGGEFIPQAVNLYDPSGLAPASDIQLSSGETLSLYSTSAPVNLRLNECVGYIPNKTQFSPQLPPDCPQVDRSQLSSFTGACQNYIESLGSCQSPDFSSPYIPQNDYACINYLENNFTYKSCFTAHEADPGFLLNQVDVWMGSSPIDPYHDQVELLDSNGLLVDLYTY